MIKNKVLHDIKNKVLHDIKNIFLKDEKIKLIHEINNGLYIAVIELPTKYNNEIGIEVVKFYVKNGVITRSNHGATFTA